MAGVVTKGTEYDNGSQITSSNLNALVDDAKFSSNAVDNGSTALNDSAIPAIIVKNGGISAVKLATDAVETAKIKDSNVTTAKILDANVTTAKIADSNVTTAKIAADAVTTAKIADDVALGGNPTTTTQSASNNSTRIATTAYVDAQCNLVPTPAIVTTFTARNSESQRYFKNLSEVNDPNSIISINSGQEIQFASTGTYLVKAGVNIDDNASATGRTYNAVLVPTHGSTTAITFGGAAMRQYPGEEIANIGVCATFTFAYVVSNTTNDRLAIYAEPFSAAANSDWEGAAVIEITKIA